MMETRPMNQTMTQTNHPTVPCISALYFLYSHTDPVDPAEVPVLTDVHLPTLQREVLAQATDKTLLEWNEAREAYDHPPFVHLTPPEYSTDRLPLMTLHTPHGGHDRLERWNVPGRF